jgi:hypothetical protein
MMVGITRVAGPNDRRAPGPTEPAVATGRDQAND